MFWRRGALTSNWCARVLSRLAGVVLSVAGVAGADVAYRQLGAAIDYVLGSMAKEPALMQPVRPRVASVVSCTAKRGVLQTARFIEALVLLVTPAAADASVAAVAFDARTIPAGHPILRVCDVVVAAVWLEFSSECVCVCVCV